MRDELLSPSQSIEDGEDNSEKETNGLRPTSLMDFVGQSELKEHLEIILGAAKKRNKQMEMEKGKTERKQNN